MSRVCVSCKTRVDVDETGGTAYAVRLFFLGYSTGRVTESLQTRYPNVDANVVSGVAVVGREVAKANSDLQAGAIDGAEFSRRILEGLPTAKELRVYGVLSWLDQISQERKYRTYVSEGPLGLGITEMEELIRGMIEDVRSQKDGAARCEQLALIDKLVTIAYALPY